LKPQVFNLGLFLCLLFLKEEQSAVIRQLADVVRTCLPVIRQIWGGN